MTIPGFDIRYSYMTDISYLRQWIKNPGILKWFPIQKKKRLKMPFNVGSAFAGGAAASRPQSNISLVGSGLFF